MLSETSVVPKIFGLILALKDWHVSIQTKPRGCVTLFQLTHPTATGWILGSAHLFAFKEVLRRQIKHHSHPQHG